MRRIGGPLPRIALTSGDPNGIGPEICLRALLDRRVRKACLPLLVGEYGGFDFYRKRFRLPVALFPVLRPPASWGADSIPVVVPAPERGVRPFVPVPGRPSRRSGAAAGRALLRAAGLWREGEAAAIVTGPLSKSALDAAGFRHPGQTEMLAKALGAPHPLMVMLSGRLRVGLATVHLPLSRVPRALTRARLASAIGTMHSSLRTDFGVRRPRLAVLGLNPHAGEGGLLGTEEGRIIAPAVRAARRRGLLVEGPFPADGFFGGGKAGRFDGILAMYHDQGLIPVKMGGFAPAVNFSAGLPMVRTSPAHGTAFDIAGSGRADHRSMVSALLAAADAATMRSRGRKR